MKQRDSFGIVPFFLNGTFFLILEKDRKEIQFPRNNEIFSMCAHQFPTVFGVQQASAFKTWNVLKKC